jgi:hypothetical protein
LEVCAEVTQHGCITLFTLSSKWVSVPKLKDLPPMLFEMPRYDGLEVLLGLQGVELQLVELVEPVQELLGHRDVLRPAQLVFSL